MRQRAAGIADYGVDALASESLGRLRAQRLSALAADPDAPPFFGRTDRDATTARRSTSAAGTSATSDGDPGRHRLAGADLAGVLPGHAGRPDGRAAAPAVRLPRRRADSLRGRAPRPRRGARPRVGPAARGDRAAPRRPDARHRRHHPARPGRAGARRPRHRRCASRARRAPARPRSACTGRRTCSTPTRAAAPLRRAGGRAEPRPSCTTSRQVLPALGEGGIEQTTVDDLVAHVPARGDRAGRGRDPQGRCPDGRRAAPGGALARPASPVEDVVVDRRHEALPGRPSTGCAATSTTPRACRRSRWTVARDRLRQQVAEDVRRQREDVGRRADATPRRRKMARSTRGARVRRRRSGRRSTRAALLTRLYTDARVPAPAARARPSPTTSGPLLHRPVTPRSVRTVHWTAADTVLLDELAGLLDGAPSYVHVVVDEAQDLSPMQCRAVARRCPLGSVTVLGDLAQATTPWAPGDWPVTPAPPRSRRRRGAAADRRLPRARRGARGGQPAAAARRRRRPARHVRARRRGRACASPPRPRWSRRCAPAGDRGFDRGDRPGRRCGPPSCASSPTAGIAAEPLDDEDDPRVTVVPASEAKGLEFDSVVLVEPAEIVAAEPTRAAGLRRLYVVLTRAVSRLAVVHDEPLPDELAA